MEKISVSSSGIFTIKEYELEEGQDFISLVSRLCAGPEEVQEVIPYVFEGEDPLGIDANPVSAEEFEEKYPLMKGYGPGLAFDVVVRREGHPVTVELTEGSRIIAINSLDKEVEIDDLLGEAAEMKPLSSPGDEEGSAKSVSGPGGEAGSAKSVSGSGSEAGSASESADCRTAEIGHKTSDEEMSPEDLLRILSEAERLKCSTRHCDTSSGRRESVAEHSWRAALMAMLLGGIGEYSEIDINRVIRMCLIHDLGEVFTGDIPTFEKNESDEEREYKLLADWIGTFPDSQRREFEDLFSEMRERKTPEARLFKALDKLEAVIQHNESDISSWLPLEYDLQFTYGKAEADQFPFLKKLRERIDILTKEKIEASEEK